MKKYYLHTESGQEGPFDVEEIKAKNIDKGSPIWYEGLSEWTTADKVEELKGAYKVTPPPFETKVQPPPLSKSDQEFVDTVKAQKPTSAVKVAGTITIVLVVLIAVGMLFKFVAMGGVDNSLLKVTLNPPQPRVVADRGGEDATSGIFNYRAGVDATILNDGGSGNILVTCYFYQGDKTYERSKELYLSANATEEVHFTFDEAKLLGDNMKYRVEAKASE